MPIDFLHYLGEVNLAIEERDGKAEREHQLCQELWILRYLPLLRTLRVCVVNGPPVEATIRVDSERVLCSVTSHIMGQFEQHVEYFPTLQTLDLLVQRPVPANTFSTFPLKMFKIVRNRGSYDKMVEYLPR